MAKGPELTTEEKWLEKMFGVDVTKLKSDYEPESSKKRAKWLLKLKVFKNSFTTFENRTKAAMKIKIPNDDKEGSEALEAVKKKFTQVKSLVSRSLYVGGADSEIDDAEAVFDTFNEYLDTKKIKNV